MKTPFKFSAMSIMSFRDIPWHHWYKPSQCMDVADCDNSLQSMSDFCNAHRPFGVDMPRSFWRRFSALVKRRRYLVDRSRF